MTVVKQKKLPIKYILLDMMDTLIPDPFYIAVKKLCGSLEKFNMYKNPAAYLSFERGEFKEEDYLKNFFRPDLLPQEIPFTIEDFVQNMHTTPALFPEVKKFLQSHCEVPLAIASNYSSWIHHHIQKLGIAPYFERIFVSYQMKCRKPDAAFFQQIIGQIKIEPEYILFVDDQPANISAAERIGFQVLQATPDWPKALDRFEWNKKADGTKL